MSAISLDLSGCQSFSDMLREIHSLAAAAAPMPAYIKREGPVTHVAWDDGTHTCVRLCAEDAQDSLYSAFCAALAKKIFGSNAAVHRMVDEHTVEFLEEQKRREQELEEQERREFEARNHKKKVRRLAKQLRLEQEARDYNKSLEMGHC